MTISLSCGIGAIQVLRNADGMGVGGGPIFQKKAVTKV